MTVTAPGDRRPRSGRAVCDRSRAWWPGGGDHRVAEGTYSELFPDVSRDAAAGLVMASRCGDLDPAVPLWLVQHAGLAAAHSCSAAGGTISNRRSNPIIRSG